MAEIKQDMGFMTFIYVWETAKDENEVQTQDPKAMICVVPPDFTMDDVSVRTPFYHEFPDFDEHVDSDELFALKLDFVVYDPKTDTFVFQSFDDRYNFKFE